ncbi:MAG: methionine--tRNA ligase [Immundisolibacter sp.]|uniref:methionine--tRNA ligase n=1 Tax=Immundisolibacter sp. TaxID=1934948 RepID=UPI003EE2F9DD
MSRRLLVTSALPYANGPIHIGHLVEYIQTDVWVRAMRLVGRDVIYLCADDAHGAPIMLRAQAEDITPEDLVARIGTEHRADFADFGIAFDNYYTTHSDENRLLAEDIFHRLHAAGHIVRYGVTRYFDPAKGMFLADRFIRGQCPRCAAQDQYGDSCEACGATYAPTDLINPRSALSGAEPVLKESEHYFFRLSDFADLLAGWTRAGHLQEEVANKIAEWFEAGLADWDISRDAPYFGFKVPGSDSQYFYVWLDAPIGYLASLWDWLKRVRGPDVSLDQVREFWNASDVRHFIGKDILYFHALFWPAMLQGAAYDKPTAVNAHGFLTVDGQKMSKSRGTFIQARTWLDHLDPEPLRYYFAAKLGRGIDDIDLNLDDFAARVNSDLVGKLVNIASRTAGFIEKRFGGRLAPTLPQPVMYAEFVSAGNDIAAAYEGREYARAMREVMALADRANEYIACAAPWTLVKDPVRLDEAHGVCSQALNLFRLLMVYLAPVLPRMAVQVEALFGAPLAWADRAQPLLDHPIAPYRPLLTRIDPAAVAALIAAGRTV